MDEPQLQPCYRHPDRMTYVTCRRCGKPICGECMIPAAVGFQCPSCVKQGSRQTRQRRGAFGGALVGNNRSTSTVLIAINLLVFLLITASQLLGFNWHIDQWLGLRPTGLCLADASGNLYYQGANQAQCAQAAGYWMPGLASGAWWQIISSIFTHSAFMHLAMNMLTLWFIGPPLESFLGRARFLAVYLIAGVGGSLAVFWLSAPLSLSYGASGALFGVMGALAIVLWRAHGDFTQLIIWIGLNLLITFVPTFAGGTSSISWQAHLGGLVTGAIVAGVIDQVHQHRAKPAVLWGTLAGLLLVFAVGFVARAMVLG
ncbi:MAG: rhomboid family intramembrane serine protease [Propionibacteriaceae bacterium]|nr:rhomboid family intramembrane serine protease [Propionibacteriaceae bacterium]